MELRKSWTFLTFSFHFLSIIFQVSKTNRLSSKEIKSPNFETSISSLDSDNSWRIEIQFQVNCFVHSTAMLTLLALMATEGNELYFKNIKSIKYLTLN